MTFDELVNRGMIGHGAATVNHVTPAAYRRLVEGEAIATTGDDKISWGIDAETYRFWMAGAGNAKARRRYRRSRTAVSPVTGFSGDML